MYFKACCLLVACQPVCHFDMKWIMMDVEEESGDKYAVSDQIKLCLVHILHFGLEMQNKQPRIISLDVRICLSSTGHQGV